MTPSTPFWATRPERPHLFLNPVFDKIASRQVKEKRLRQRARVVWLYGLSGSGKTTLGTALERRLLADRFTVHLLDGDNLRSGLNKSLGFSDADRAENIRRASEVARLFVDAGMIVICAFITPRQALRDLARDIIGADNFLAAYLSASFETCAKRDPKGLYARARQGAIAQFTGRDSVFEPPARSAQVFSLDTEKLSIEDSLARLHAFVLPHIRPSA